MANLLVRVVFTNLPLPNPPTDREAFSIAVADYIRLGALGKLMEEYSGIITDLRLIPGPGRFTLTQQFKFPHAIDDSILATASPTDKPAQFLLMAEQFITDNYLKDRVLEIGGQIAVIEPWGS